MKEVFPTKFIPPVSNLITLPVPETRTVAPDKVIVFVPCLNIDQFPEAVLVSIPEKVELLLELRVMLLA
jgi:hypothetical protein